MYIHLQLNTNAKILILSKILDIFLEKLKTLKYIVKDNICDRLLYMLGTIIAQFDAKSPIFLYDIDLTLENLFKIYSRVKLAGLYRSCMVDYENIRYLYTSAS